jgi:hypothetical protein
LKYLFLDVDGVLNCAYTSDRCGKYIGIDDRKVELLRKIIDATDAKIVLSSTWRLGYTRYGESLEGHRQYLNEKLAKQGLSIYSQTDDLSIHGKNRGQEIDDWLSKHDVDEWVVLDDEYFYDFSFYNIMPHWVQTDYYSPSGGLTEEDVQIAIRILNGENAYDVEKDFGRH